MVSDILESNGSSSMASVCGSSLSLMDAGVPIARPVAGIAMGLIKEGDDYIVLTDIAGVEDHLGDMDFKVAGTERGITALQMDIKIAGVTFDILRDALSRAHEARTVILGKMADVIDTPREELSRFAPRIQTIQIDPSQIGLLIGKGGETIRALSEEFESQIDVTDDGQVLIYSTNGELGEALVERIRMMLKEVEVGDEYIGKVVKTTNFGAFVELSKGTDGLLHISNISPGERVETVEDVLNRGDEVQVRVVEVDRERGRIGLRLATRPRDRRARPREELAAVAAAAPAGGGGRGGGGRRSERAARTAPAPADVVSAAARRGRGSGRPRRGPGRDRELALEHRSTTLDSGLRVVTERVPAMRSVALGFWIVGGSALESDPEAGISHLLEHMLFRGTERYGSVEIDQIFDEMGSGLNAETDKEATSLSSRVLDTHLRARLRRDERHALAAGAARSSRPSARWSCRRSPPTKTIPRTRSSTASRRPSSAITRSAAPVIGTRRASCAASNASSSARFHGERYAPERASWSRPPGPWTTRSSCEMARASCPQAAEAPARDARGARAAPAMRAAHALPAQGHRAVPRLHRGSRHRARRRAALRAAGAGRRARRHALLAPLPGGPRAPRPRLQRLLFSNLYAQHRGGRNLRGHARRRTSPRRSR